MALTTKWISCLFASSTLMLAVFALGGAGAGESEAVGRGTQVSITGVIDAWRLREDGSVLFRVRPTPSDKGAASDLGPRWFLMDATLHEDMRPEVQLLQVILLLGGHDDHAAEVITVVGEADQDETGSDPTKPIALSWLGFSRAQ